MTDELLKALQLIKEECKKHTDTCKECPMRVEHRGCGVTHDSPENWKLEKREVYF